VQRYPRLRWPVLRDRQRMTMLRPCDKRFSLHEIACQIMLVIGD
jgi:hypothetical protein